jgi:O-antigen/teichoic acid export membrane protein
MISGYAAMGANTLYTLCSVPLALAYLSPAQFGLWALATQITTYLALIDFGITGATARILVDYKDESKGFSGILQAATLVNIAQGLLVLCVGAVAATVMGPVFGVPDGMHNVFSYLILGHCTILGGTFALRIFPQALIAQQRADIGNCIQIAGFIASYGVLWICFELRMGVYSVVAAQAVSLVLTTSAQAIACSKLGLLPRIHLWVRPDWRKFRELFTYGSDVFVFALGSQLVNASQIIIISRTLGLEAAAVWSICTRSLTLMIQFVGRVLDFAAPPLFEMFVRGEVERLLQRFRGVTIFSQSLAVCVAALFVSCNQTFVSLWVGRKFTWPVSNDILLGVWFVLFTVQRCYVGSLGITKQLKVIKYVYLAEGLVFVILSLTVIRWAGLAGVIASSIFCTICFTMAYGVTRTRRYFKLSVRLLLSGWFAPTFRTLALIVPFTAGISVITADWNDPVKLVLRGAVVSCGAAILLWRLGITREMQTEIMHRSPSAIRTGLALALRPLGMQSSRK